MSFLLSSGREWKCLENVQWASYLLLSFTHFKQRPKAAWLAFLKKVQESLENIPSPGKKRCLAVSVLCTAAGTGILVSPLEAKGSANTLAERMGQNSILKYMFRYQSASPAGKNRSKCANKDLNYKKCHWPHPSTGGSCYRTGFSTPRKWKVVGRRNKNTNKRI